ncbi:putative endopolygalacturonase II [Aphelenchoides avenae]|nr:putative endopolygalacturonase II [Aphelenchus avenae]
MSPVLPAVAFVLLGISSVSAADPCTVTKFEDVAKQKTACATLILNGIAVPAGATLDLSGLKPNTKVIFQGETTFGYKEFEDDLILISGKQITVQGAAGHILNGDGARWWDGQGGNGGKKKPKFIRLQNLDSSSVTGLYVKNAPKNFFSIQSNDLTLTNITCDNKDGDSLGHNTDAFDIGNSKGVSIIGPKVHNQDDCLAVNSGENIIFTGAECVGGHGISIGSVGGRSNNVVRNVTISHSTIKDSDNGARIKTVYGATGSVSEVTYSDITLSNIAKYGVVIQQDYENGKPTGNPTNGIKIDKLKVERVTGSVAAKAVPVYLLCGSGSCTNWTFTGVSISGGKAPAKCSNVPAGVTWTGIQCPK